MLALLCAQYAFGQNEAEEEYEFEQDTLILIQNAIKFDPVQILYGDFRIYYERVISNQFSFQIAAGITRRNYTAGWFDYELDNFGENIDIQTGYSISFSVRRYFEDLEEPDGLYLDLGINYRTYSKGFAVFDSTGTLTGDVFEDNRNILSASSKIGFQLLSLTSNLFFDIYTGPAIRFKDFQIVRSTDLNDPSAYFIEPLEEIAFGWDFGVRLGLGF